MDRVWQSSPSICEEAGFELLEDFVGLSEKDIREMADGYEKHTQAQGRIPFGLRCIRDFHCRTTTGHKAYHFRVGVIKE